MDGEDDSTSFGPVLRIYDILVSIRIQIRRSMPLINGFGSRSCYFHHWPSRRQQKSILNKFFQHFTFLRYIYIIDRMIEESGSGSIPLTNGSGSGSKGLKNMWIQIQIRFRICNTVTNETRGSCPSIRTCFIRSCLLICMITCSCCFLLFMHEHVQIAEILLGEKILYVLLRRNTVRIEVGRAQRQITLFWDKLFWFLTHSKST
jgi:hypothetical protein